MINSLNQPISAEQINPNLQYVYPLPYEKFVEFLQEDNQNPYALFNSRGMYFLATQEPLNLRREIDLEFLNQYDQDLQLIETNLNNLSQEFLEAKSLTERSSAVILDNTESLYKVNLLSEGIHGEIFSLITLVSKSAIQD